MMDREFDPTSKCTVAGCESRLLSRGLCNKHYKRWQKTGSTDGPQSRLDWLLSNANSGTDECVRWPRSVTSAGYGQVTVNGQKRLAHRVSCEVFNGPPPGPGLHAAHSCNNRRCVNPRHLRWATPTENCADKIQHGTYTSGEKSLKAKLTNEQAIAVFFDPRPRAHIARDYGIDPAAVRLIKEGRTYKAALGMV